MNNSTYILFILVILFLGVLSFFKEKEKSKKMILPSLILLLSIFLLLYSSCSKRAESVSEIPEVEDSISIITMAPPVAVGTNESAEGVSKDYETIPVFFGTDRKRSGNKDVNFFYGKNSNRKQCNDRRRLPNL